MTMKNNLKSSIDNIVEEILNVHNQKAFKVRALRFTEDAFSCDSTEIDWVLFCDAAKKTFSKQIRAFISVFRATP